ncbi:uncharacterized protein EI90DRAFT_3062017 [Cantharellus anzutake]|uniref:uncharacterized protein n=1 Tax=Cantharellus anzutake TaxID=1750568 RepID=UPI0019065786|nr:uncharacterized protein EI90DRAFT_3062017 [Cantharellus anzutake]KAF8329787.1 hypothetical protein EI90DRAFT_3062017 [Cantharellus anzutake]
MGLEHQDNVTYIPSHPHLFRVHFAPGFHSSSLKATRDFVAGEEICRLEGVTNAENAWDTIQYGKNQHIRLNSDLVYVNHSCDPNIAFDLSSANREDWYSRALKTISKGDALSFFYPSTEWEMDQPFECWCGSGACLGQIKGAAFLPREELETRGYVSPHIRTLAEERGIWPS